jgi:NADH:ubiquinone oxidoreductase subunit E
MAVTLKDLYDAFNAGASRATLLRLVEELERTRTHVPPDLRQEIAEMTDVDDDDRGE